MGYDYNKNIFLNIDCMEYMKNISNKYFDLAIVDPPYGIGAGNINFKNRTSNADIGYKLKDWDTKIPDKNYFNELFRISKNQIIWGGNYFIEYLYNTKNFIFWDKKTGNNSYADGELAWTSFNKPVKKYTELWLGANARNKNYKRIHPTEKSIKMYKWVLENYAEKGNLIFDSHVGSGSLLIACEILEYYYVGCEIDNEYYTKAKERIENDRYNLFNLKD